ncbi:MAG TPA: hypothetical protein DEH78_18495 [Solibacterales bacterium]|nr:hypothetical protein [Bryobacterales bacterium]
MATAPAFVLHPDLEDARRQIEAIRAEVRVLTGPLTDLQMNWRAGEGQWSIAECIGHLTVSAHLFLPVVAEAIAKGIPGTGEFRYGRFENWVIGKIGKRGGFKVKAPKDWQPPKEQSREECLRAFESAHATVLARIVESNGLHLRRTRVRHPAIPLLTYSLCGIFRMTAAHCRRHLAQAQEVRAAAGFPR